MHNTTSFNRHTQGTRDALAIVANPQRADARPGLRLLAWAMLKSARGQTVRQHRLQTQGSENV